MMNRLRASTSTDHPQVERLTVFGRSVIRQLGLRAIVNLATATGVVLLLFVLRVDFPLMWGILAFFLSFIPWIGLPLAVAPAVILALAEHGLTNALLVIAGVIVINILAENALADAHGTGLEHLADVPLLGSSSGRGCWAGRGVPGCAAHHLPDLDAGDLPRDALACERDGHGRP